jgi:hypothetical protein
MRLSWMEGVTLVVVGATVGALILGCGAGNVGGPGTQGRTSGVAVLPVSDVRRELGQVVGLDHILSALDDPALSEEGRLSTAASAYRANLQQAALLLEQRYPRERPIDAVVREATSLPLGDEAFGVRAGRTHVALLRLFYLATQAKLADAVAKLADTNPANDTSLSDGAPRDWDAAWAYYHGLDDTAILRTSTSPIEFPQFAGTLHEGILRAFLEGQNALLFGARAAGGSATTGSAGGGRVRVRQYGGGTPGGSRPGDIRPTGPDVASVLRQEAFLRRKLLQCFYLSTIREATETVLRLEAGEVDAANAARGRALEFCKGLFVPIEQATGAGTANDLLTLLSTPVAVPGDFDRARREALVNTLNAALAGALPAEDRVSPVQLRQRAGTRRFVGRTAR